MTAPPTARMPRQRDGQERVALGRDALPRVVLAVDVGAVVAERDDHGVRVFGKEALQPRPQHMVEAAPLLHVLSCAHDSDPQGC